MKVKLHSDFLDYYDHHFDREGLPFFRNSRDSLSRTNIFNTMKTWGLNVPLFGKCSDLKNQFSDDYKVVVYEDEYAHCGEGKKLSSYKEALEKYPDKLVSEYLVGEAAAVSMRYLSIGNQSFIITYRSDDQWRSNVGNVNIKVASRLEPSESNFTNHPLFAIDFVKDYDTFYAVDFNSAPGLKDTGIEDILSPKEVVKLIKDKLEQVHGK